MIECPNCGKEADFEHYSSYSVQPHGESFWEEWYRCVQCGASATREELDAALLQERSAEPQV